MSDPHPKPIPKPDETKMQLIEYGPNYSSVVAKIYAIDAITDQLEDTIANRMLNMTLPEHFSRLSPEDVTDPEFCAADLNWFDRVLRYRPEVLGLPENMIQPLFKPKIVQLKNYLKDVAGVMYLDRRKRAVDVLGRFRGAAAYGRTMEIKEEDWIRASNRKGAYPISYETVKEGRL